MTKIAVGEFVAQRRKVLGLSQSGLSKRLFLSPQAISALERRSSAVSIEFFCNLCHALRISFSDFVNREANAPLYIKKKMLETPKIAEKLLFVRKKKGISRSELSAMTAVSDKTIRNYETCSQAPTIQYIESFCNATNFPIEEILSEKPISSLVEKKQSRRSN